MVHLNYSSLLALGADLSGGIKGTIDKPGGKITVEVYPYDGNEADGFQKLVSLDQILNRKKIVYSAYSDESNVNKYIEKTINVPYGFDANNDRRFKVLKNTTSNNIKLLGGTSQNSWWSSTACSWLPVRYFSWMAWNIKSLFWEVPDACNEVVTKFRTGKQPVILKITIKDATLYDYKIPGIANNVAFNLKRLEEYKIIKKLKVTILESPNDSKSVAFYKEMVEDQLKETNRYYSAKTGNVKHPLMNAEVGNPRILFKNVDLIIKKASRENYNREVPAENNLLESDAGVNNNDGETMQLLFIHSFSIFYPPGTTNTRVIRGYSTNLETLIQNSDYTVCSYSRWSDNSQVYGSFGLTVAHEFGHYFSLYHTFGGGCSQRNGGDQVADTPPAEDGMWYMLDAGTPNERGIDNPCQNFPSCSGTRRQVENIMDYGPCRWLFTKGQADRITDRINTKSSLFSTLNVYDTDPRVNPDVINFSITDLRHGEMRRKAAPEIPGLSVRMIYPSSKNGDYIVKVVSDKAEKGKIVIFNDNRIKVYEKEIRVEKGSNDFVIESNLFDRIGLYTLFYTSTSASQQIRILPLHP
ncbi:M43 family zinc metalloprotease [Chryseobacterium sp. 1B4]